MNRRTRIVLVAALAPAALGAQQPAPVIPTQGATTTAFVPEGYLALFTVPGALDDDAFDDAVLVLGDRRETVDSMVDHRSPRVLVVLRGTAQGFELAVRNDHAILGQHDGGVFGDPLDAVAIERRTIVITHSGGSAWRWRYVHRFREQSGTFELIGRTITSYYNARHCDAIDEFQPTTFDDINFITRRHEHDEVPEDRCVKRQIRGLIAPGPLTPLATFDILADLEDDHGSWKPQ